MRASPTTARPPAALRLGLCALSVLLAWLTYELVEKKVRFAKLPAMRRIAVPALAASMAAAALAGVLASQGRLLPQSAALPYVREASRAHNDWNYDGDRIILGQTGKAVLFFGDSHMQHYWPRIQKLLAEHAAAPRNTIILKTSGGCAPVPGIERKRLRCSQFVDAGFNLARRPEIDTVVIAASWVGMLKRGDYYRVGDPEQRPLELLTPQTEWVLQGFQAELAELTAAGKHVVLMLSSPRGSALDPKSVIDRETMTVHVRRALAPLPRSELAALTAPIDERLQAHRSGRRRERGRPHRVAVHARRCARAPTRSGRPLYKDDSHLRASVARERFGADGPLRVPALSA